MKTLQFLTPLGLELPFLGRLARSQSLYRLRYHGSSLPVVKRSMHEVVRSPPNYYLSQKKVDLFIQSPQASKTQWLIS
jgi:hypothetical protein